ncbi:MAG: isochorismatase family protein [Bacteroidota bacterium]|nr:isochorismatase family protein [Bacteroidota bacterium]
MTIQKQLEKYRVRRKIIFMPEDSALLIIDMQRYFLEKESHAYIPAAQKIIPRIKQLAHQYSMHGLPIIFTRHINTKNDAKLMSTWWGDLIVKDDPMSEIIPALTLYKVPVIKKSQYDAFFKTKLEDVLRKRKVKQIVITGVMTHLCCETTARSAFMRGFEVFFTIDGTASDNIIFHNASLLNLADGFALPVYVEEIKNAIKQND